MLKKTFLILFISAIFFSCKKEEKGANGIQFTVNAKTIMKVQIAIARNPPGQVGAVIDSYNSNFVTGPYSYTFPTVQKGDLVVIEVSTDAEQAIDATLKVKGQSFSPVKSTLNDPDQHVSIKNFEVTAP